MTYYMHIMSFSVLHACHVFPLVYLVQSCCHFPAPHFYFVNSSVYLSLSVHLPQLCLISPICYMCIYCKPFVLPHSWSVIVCLWLLSNVKSFVIKNHYIHPFSSSCYSHCHIM